ncbi:mechanosensitive ion channel family protein [Thermomicrobiaceae bacterium CFH 74404]|uniref:Mechanosensitive ion channel family protein n=2 Tax=Thermomicrobia TaxID=189775 RepID=A0AA42B9U2_9BACT|nr:mechanosensitive ion channel family protein [Thermalbibacter longus]MCM8749071.1 mechanosensitive ion channel family protein [Thermalbibacter longus]
MPRWILEAATNTATVTGTLVDRGQALGDRILTALPSIVITVGLAWLVLRMLRGAIRQTIRRVLERRGEAPREIAVRLNTLASIIESAVRFVVLIVAGMTVLSTLGIPIGPLLASAGVAGLAIGLGAQSLIRDLIGGFFIVLEDQYHVGDVIQVNNTSGPSGLVEQLTLRYTALRGLDGSYTIVPNGDIRTVTNLTKDWARAVIDVDIAYEEDLGKAMAVLQEVLGGLDQDPELAHAILEPGEILGVEALSPSHATVRLMVKTRPMEQWRVARALRQRIKTAFEQAGITIPYPRNVTIVQPATEFPSPSQAQQQPTQERRA